MRSALQKTPVARYTFLMEENDVKVLRLLIESSTGMYAGPISGIIKIPEIQVVQSLNNLEDYGYARHDVLHNSALSYRPTTAGKRYFSSWYTKFMYFLLSTHGLTLIAAITGTLAAIAAWASFIKGLS